MEQGLSLENVQYVYLPGVSSTGCQEHTIPLPMLRVPVCYVHVDINAERGGMLT
jgi:hypothetical protein